MPTPAPPEDEIAAVAEAFARLGSKRLVEQELGMTQAQVYSRLRHASLRKLNGTLPVVPGFEMNGSTAQLGPDGELQKEWVRQRPARGGEFEPAAGQVLAGESVLVDGERNVLQKWELWRAGSADQTAAMRAVVDAFKSDLPRAAPVAGPLHVNGDLLNQFTVTDLHFGMLSWAPETGADYDLDIAERLLVDWFAAAIAMAPPAHTAILAQMGDLLHYDGMESKTPTSGHILDADSRLPKVIRVVIRTMRRVVAMLLEKHEHVHIIMADANHDPSSEAWLREMFASFFEDEPRVTVDSSASTYYVYEHGDTSLFFHHGHKRKVGNVDSVFAGQFREVYGRTKYSYAHLGHLHSDELKSTNLMKVERHETLAAADAYAANGGWLSGRSAKVITYSKTFGEVGRLTLTPQMVMGAANDNEKGRAVA